MIFSTKIMIVIALFLIFSLAQGCATLGDLSGIGASSARVEQFPEGKQVNTLIGSFFTGLKDVNVETRVFDAPYDKVWSAAKLTAEKLDKMGKRPLVAVDEKNGRISNGAITESALIGLGSGAWADQFQIEVTSVSDNKTKVDVARKVVENEMVAFGNRPGTYGTSVNKWKSQWSNGNIEKWILTQIEDQLTNQASGQKGERVSSPKPGVSSAPLPKPETAPTASSPTPKETQGPVLPPQVLVASPPKPEAASPSPSILAPKEAEAAVAPKQTPKAGFVTTRKKGERVEKLDKSGNWFKVKLLSGETGWVFKDLVKEAE